MRVSECAGLKSFTLVFSLAPILPCELCAKAGVGASLRALVCLCAYVTLAADSAVVSQWSGG